MKDDTIKDPVEPEVYERTEKLDTDFNSYVYDRSTSLNTEPDAMLGWRDPISRVPLGNVPEQFRPQALALLQKYEKLLARSEFDAGDCSSKMNAYFYIPLEKKMPRSAKPNPRRTKSQLQS